MNEMENFSRRNVDEKEIEAALLSIVGHMHEEKEKELSSILESDPLKLSPNTLTNASTKFFEATSIRNQ